MTLDASAFTAEEKPGNLARLQYSRHNKGDAKISNGTYENPTQLLFFPSFTVIGPLSVIDYAQ